MNKAELVDAIVAKTMLARRDVERVLETMLDEVVATLKAGGDVTLTSFGTFSARVRKARLGVNPQKPSEKIHIPQVTVPKFKAGLGLKNALKK